MELFAHEFSEVVLAQVKHIAFDVPIGDTHESFTPFNNRKAVGKVLTVHAVVRLMDLLVRFHASTT